MRRIDQKKAEKMAKDLGVFLCAERCDLFDMLSAATNSFDEYEEYCNEYYQNLKSIEKDDSIGCTIGKLVDNILYTQQFDYKYRYELIIKKALSRGND